MDNLIEHTLRNFPLGSFWNFDDLVVSDDGHFVALGVESDAFARNIVDHDRVEVLGCELLAGVFEDILSFCGKPNDNLRLPAQRNFLENVCRRFEFERESDLCVLFSAETQISRGSQTQPRS